MKNAYVKDVNEKYLDYFTLARSTYFNIPSAHCYGIQFRWVMEFEKSSFLFLL